MRKIFLLAIAGLMTSPLLAQQPTTMIVSTTNGGAVRTDVAEVEKITFADTTYNTISGGYRIYESNELLWPEDRLLPCFLPPTTLKTLDMPAIGLSDQERIMCCALQGLVNRTRPRILLYNHKEEAITIWPTANNLKTSAVSSAYALVKQFKGEINGLVLYSTEKSEHYANLAMTIAGLDRLLPVTAEIQEKLKKNNMEFEVKVDLTKLTYSSAKDIYNYLYNNYWSRCNHRLLISERPLIPYVHDIGVACGSACVYLDPRNSGENTVLEKMLKTMTPGRDFVFGWFPEERSGMGAATKFGLTTVPGDFFENASVYSAVNKPVKIMPVPKRPKLENKVYASIYLSDGDNAQYCEHAMAKIFEQGGRGKLALNWTISPALVDIAPNMLNYYYKKATANDCFVSGPSGLGYIMPYNKITNSYYRTAQLDAYTKLTNRYLEKSGLRVITIWDDINDVQRKNYGENCTYLYGLTNNHGSRATLSKRLAYVPFSPDYAPSSESVRDHWKGDINKFNGTAPVFVTGQVSVWDAGPDKLASLPGLVDALSPGNVLIVRADHWFSYYCEANRLPFNLCMLQNAVVTSSPVKTKVEYATNGTPSDGYMWISSETNGTAWVQMDFQENFKISRYVIRHAEAGGLEPQLNTRDFTVEVSLDGQDWTTIGTYTDNLAPVTEASLATTVTARYVRVNVTNGGADGIVRIGDIEIYGAR